MEPQHTKKISKTFQIMREGSTVGHITYRKENI